MHQNSIAPTIFLFDSSTFLLYATCPNFAKVEQKHFYKEGEKSNAQTQ